MKGDYDAYKIKTSLTTFKRLQQEQPELVKRVGYWNYVKILTTFSSLVLEELFSNPQGFELPSSFGRLIIIGFKAKRRKGYVEKKKQYLDLAKTDNHIYRLVWLTGKFSCRIPYIELWRYQVGKLIQRRMTKYIREHDFFNWITLNTAKDLTTFECRQ